MKLFSPEQLARWKVVDYGFTGEAVPESLPNYNQWVDQKKHTPLMYLEGERQQKRQNVKEHYPDFVSALVCLFSYHDSHQALQEIYQNDSDWNGLKLASYILGFEGEDYHHLIKRHLVEIGEHLKTQFPGLDYRLTLDTHPVLERDLAYRAGLGWFGKNSMLINRHHGSFVIIGSLLLNQNLAAEEEREVDTDHCGQCSACVEACPTQAIDPATRTIVAQDCISTFTIEQFKLDTTPSLKMNLKSGWIFGCDICQDVCPWNKRLDRLRFMPAVFKDKQKHVVHFFLKKERTTLLDELEKMTEGEFKRALAGTSFERSGRRGLLKNLRLLLKQLNILS